MNEIFLTQAARKRHPDRWEKGNTAVAARLREGFFVPSWRPRFAFPENPSVFAIGSCFARNVEAALHARNIEVLSVARDDAQMEIRTNLSTGLLNQYNPASIQQELEWAAGLHTFPEDGFFRDRDRYRDLFLHDQAPGGSLEAVVARRAALKAYYARLFTADIVIVTLGLVEVWYDRKTRRVTNGAPSPRIAAVEPERFFFKCLDVSDCLTLLGSIQALLDRFAKPGCKTVFTVSPIPLRRTFSGMDVALANMLSKSTLRAAVGEFVRKRENTDYYPSYESVMLSEPSLAFKANRRDVSDAMIAHVMGHFMASSGLCSLPQRMDNSVKTDP